jgi:transposase
VIERTLSWLHQYRRLRVRYERLVDIHEAFLTIRLLPDRFKQLQAAGSL